MQKNKFPAPTMPSNPLRTAAEQQLTAENPTLVSGLLGSTDAQLHELQVHTIELEMQNESLRQAESTQDELRNRFVDLFDFAPLGYLTLNKENLITEINLTAADMLGVERNKLLLRCFPHWIAPESREIWERFALHLRQQGGKHSCELWLRQGASATFCARLDGVAPGNDSTTSLRVALTDITERKRTERAIHENEDRMLLATEATGVGIWEWNIITNKIRWDAQMFRIYGLAPTPDGFVDYHVWSNAVAPEDLREQEAQMQKAIRLLERGSRDFRIHRADTGECRHIQAVETVRTNAQGQAEWLLGTNLDVTERKLSELALMEVSQRKDEFLAMLAHELRNPLAPICNAVHILQQATADPNRIVWCGNIINRQLEHLIRLVDDLLDISRINSGFIELNNETLEIRDFIQPAIEACQPLLDASRHEFSLTLPTETLWVVGDRIRLAQIISNLLNNAAKYTPEGGQIKLSVAAEEERISLQVADNGCGIDPADLNKLFDLFYQAKRNLDRSHGGLGIGLSLVHNLVEKHGGEVRAFSSGRGQGSQFRVWLPRSQPIAVLAVETSGAGVNPNILNILVVDDNPDVADSLCIVLEMEGHRVQIAHDAPSAITLALATLPDVILLDIGLPGMDGYQVAQALRRSPELQRTLLIALTGYGSAEDKEKSQAAGFDVHLVKPADINTLWELMTDYANRRNLAASN